MAEKDLSAVAQRIYLSENSMLCYGPLVSEFGGGGRVHGASQPRHWGTPGSAAYDNKYTNTQTEAPIGPTYAGRVVCRRAKNRESRRRQRQSVAAVNRAAELTARRCDVGLTSRHRRRRR